MDLSVIIVSFNTREKLKMTLESVFRSETKYRFEVWVADNASSDRSAEMVVAEFPQVKLIQNKENVGYARANNIAIRQMIHNPSQPPLILRGGEPPLRIRGGEGELRDSESRYILLLNSDVEVSADTFDKMIEYMDNDDTVGISGCKVLKPNGQLDLACRRSFPNFTGAIFRFTGLSFLFPKSRLSSYNLTYLPQDDIAEVDSVMGAFLLIKKQTIDTIGLLDEQYFMYGEDMDWCFRAKEAGYKVMYAPITTVTHHKGSSSRKAPRKALYEFHRAMQIFYDKHYRQKYNGFINFLVRVGIWSRYIIKFIINEFRRAKYVSK